MNKGWRGESYRHYLAAKGVRTTQKQYYSKFSDMLTRTLSRAEREKSARIATYSNPYAAEATPGSQSVLLQAKLLGEQAKSTPLTQEEARAIAEKKFQQEKYELSRRQRIGLSADTQRILLDPNEAVRRAAVVDQYLENIQNVRGYLLKEREAAEIGTQGKTVRNVQGFDEPVPVRARAEAAAKLARVEQKLSNLELVATQAQRYKDTIQSVASQDVSPDVLDRDIKLKQVWKQIREGIYK